MEAKIYNWNGWLEGETNPKILIEKYTNMIRESGFHILNMIEHHFNPFGYTALLLLCESHFAIHSFPEENKTYLELSSCNKQYFDRFLILHKRV